MIRKGRFDKRRFGQAVAQYRRTLERTQEEVASKLGLTIRQVRAIEYGKAAPLVSALLLAEWAGLDLYAYLDEVPL